MISSIWYVFEKTDPIPKENWKWYHSIDDKRGGFFFCKYDDWRMFFMIFFYPISNPLGLVTFFFSDEIIINGEINEGDWVVIDETEGKTTMSKLNLEVNV